MERYSRQIRFEPIGEQGQQRLLTSQAVLVGCGALGSVIAETLVRAGVGHLRIVDRDFLELSNLQRQVLFDEQDVADHLPKAIAAQRKLKRINSSVRVEAIVDDVNYKNIETLVAGAELILDGTDNFDTRYLINDVAVKKRIPWIYGGCIAASGLVAAIIPGQTLCLRCLFEHAPPADLNPTCETAGVLGPAAQVVGSVQAAEAIKILSGNLAAVSRKMFSFDLWSGSWAGLNLDPSGSTQACPCCQGGHYDYLEGRATQHALVLCGRDAVQINPPEIQSLDLRILAQRLEGLAASVVQNDFLLRAEIEEVRFTVFPTGRAIINGTSQPERARSLYAKYIGG